MSATTAQKCLTRVKGAWAPATVKRAHEDGTYCLKLPGKSVLPLWYGVTPAECSFDDRAHWPGCLAALELGDSVGLPEFQRVLSAAGATASADAIATFWRTTCDQPEDARLTPAQAHRLLVKAGFCARELRDRLAGRARPGAGRFTPIYWNQLRMGGRDPGEVAREVTAADAFAALGLTGSRSAEQARAARARAAKRSVSLPGPLELFLAAAGLGAAVREIQPNNPHLCALDRNAPFFRGLRRHGVDGDVGWPLVEHHDFCWVAVFDTDADVRAEVSVYVTWFDDDADDGADEDPAQYIWRPAAPSVAFFFWDLAQTALGWWQDTGYQGGKPVVSTDIGLALKRPPTPDLAH